MAGWANGGVAQPARPRAAAARIRFGVLGSFRALRGGRGNPARALRARRAAAALATKVTFRLATWNVNSLKVRLPHLLDWLAEAELDKAALKELVSGKW